MTRSGFMRAGIMLGLLMALGPQLSVAEVLVHETFADNDIRDGTPATWEGTCFQWECGPDPPTADLVLEDGNADVTFRNFAMWRLKSVDGQEVEPSDSWSLRARITPQRGENGQHASEGSIIGVGLDEYYWAAGMHLTGNGGVSALATGRFNDSRGGNGDIPFFEPWVVQVDFSPNRAEAYRWPVSDPSNVSTAVRSGAVKPSLPVFWGNWGGNSVFHEVIVATEPMGVGGDFDRSDAVDVDDLNALSAVIQAGSNDPRYNLNADEIVDGGDLDVWLSAFKQTVRGDVDLDGEVGFGDFLVLSENFGQTGGWAMGDFDSDNLVQFSDFLILAKNYGETTAAAASVPEPTSFALSLPLGLGILALRRRSR